MVFNFFALLLRGVLLFSWGLLAVAQASDDSAYSDYWNQELAKITAPLKTSPGQRPVDGEKIKSDIKALHERMLQERTEMTKYAKEYQEKRKKQQELDAKRQDLFAVQSLQAQRPGSVRGKDYAEKLQAYYGKHLPGARVAGCESLPGYFWEGSKVVCSVTDDKGKTQEVDLDQFLKSEATAISTKVSDLKIADTLQNLSKLSHQLLEQDDQVIAQLAANNYADLAKNLNHALAQGDYKQVDEKVGKILEKFLQDLFTNQRAANTLSRKWSELLASSRQGEADLMKLVEKLDEQIAKTTIGNFVERTALGVACTVKDKPDMCGGTATDLASKINNARKQYGEKLVAPAEQEKSAATKDKASKPE